MVASGDPVASLGEAVRGMRFLLILDSCEHVIEPVAVLAETLFNAGLSVHILATSREPMRVEGEHVHRLSPLQCPPDRENLSASEVLRFPAAQLFIERAIAASASFELTDGDASAVAHICRRLDGIPLALELASSGVDVFGIKGLAARLEDRLWLTTRGRRTAIPRHQTLSAMLDWSYDRLSASEQLLLSRLSIFSGAFTFDAASAVCSGDGLSEGEVPSFVVDLVAKSLISANPGTEVSYRLLDTTRSYAVEKLGESGERPAFAERHARYVCKLFQTASKQWEERPTAEWLETYRLQTGNLRASLRWAFSDSGDPALGVVLTIAAVPLWSQLSLIDEFLGWVELALSASGGLLDTNRRAEMQLYAALGGLQMYAISSVKQANNAWETVLTLATSLGETDYQLRALRALWAEAINAGEFRHALSVAEQFQAVALQAGTLGDKIISDRLIGTALHFLGVHEQALVATERMLSRYVPSIARSDIVRYQFNQKVAARIVRGRILWMQGRTESALRDIEENVSEALTLEHSMSLCNVLTQAACPVALLAGEFEIARRYIDLLREHTKPRSLDIWYTYAECFEAELEIERGNVQVGFDSLDSALEELRRSGFGHYRTSFLILRARGLVLLNRVSDARTTVAEALQICERTGERWCLPELHRITGELALTVERPNGVEVAVEAFHQALMLAREQSALAWRLRAATSLVRCVAGDARIGDARMMLRDIYGQFTEGLSRPELKAAALLLEQPAGN